MWQGDVSHRREKLITQSRHQRCCTKKLDWFPKTNHPNTGPDPTQTHQATAQPELCSWAWQRAWDKIQMPPARAHCLPQPHPSTWNGERGKHGGWGTVGIAWHKGLSVKGVWIPPFACQGSGGREGERDRGTIIDDSTAGQR